MSVYANKVFTHEAYYDNTPVLPDIDAESLFYDESVEPSEENFLVAGARICAESTINMNRIMEACSIVEFQYFDKTGTDMIYTEGALSGFFEKAKQFFINLWKKIQGVFKKAIMIFNTKAKDDKAFYNKYKKQLTAAQNKNYGDTEVPFYKYKFYNGGTTKYLSASTISNWDDLTKSPDKNKICTYIENVSGVSGIATAIAKVATTNDNNPNAIGKGVKYKQEEVDKLHKDVKDLMDKVDDPDWKTDYLDKIRGNLIKDTFGGNPGDVSASEFSKEIAEAAQGDSSKEDVSMSQALRDSVKWLQDSKDVIKALDKALKDWKRNIDDTLRALNHLQRDLEKGQSKEVSADKQKDNYYHSVCTVAIALSKDIKGIGIAFHTNVITQIKACSGQSKSICVKAVNYKAPKNESYAYTMENEYENESFLGEALAGVDFD